MPFPCRPQLEVLEQRVTPSDFSFDNPVIATNNPMAVVSHPPTSDTSFDEVEAGDDFILNQQTNIQSGTFTGLLPTGTPLANVTDVTVEIYRVFPNDSNVNRTSGPNTTPPFQTANVPTRQNSPSDVAFASRDSAAGELTFTGTILAASFTANNSVTDNGINAKPNQTTGGNGALTGEEVQFHVNFSTSFDLPAGHYFFVPQVQLTGNPSPGFLWLAAVRPNSTLSPDLQAWIRDSKLDPDWLRIGTDIVGGNPAPTFNLAFSLAGQTVPPPSPSPAPAPPPATSTLPVNQAFFLLFQDGFLLSLESTLAQTESLLGISDPALNNSIATLQAAVNNNPLAGTLLGELALVTGSSFAQQVIMQI